MRILLVITFFVSTQVLSNEYGVEYFTKIFGHVHDKPYELAASETAIACGFPVKVFEKQDHKYKDWVYVQTGDKKGYIAKKYLSKSRPECFQKKYNQFYNDLGLSLSDLYYWARLYDQYIIIDTKP